MKNCGHLSYKTIKDIALKNKRVLIRVDMNVPIHHHSVCDNSRIIASLPTLQYALNAGAGVIVMTHLGRPKEGVYSLQDDVSPIACSLSNLLGQEVKVIDNWQDRGVRVMPGEIVMLQNVRFNVGEKADSILLGKAYAQLGEVFINDAFGSAHRAQASTHAVAKFMPEVACGFLLDAELKHLTNILSQPQRPLLAVVGGSKVSTKLQVLERLADKVDHLIVGGGIANTFLLAAGYQIGRSLVEKNLLSHSSHIMEKIKARGAILPLPQDVYTAKEISPTASINLKAITAIEDDDLILDFGPHTMQKIDQLVQIAKTVLWNGPIGVFEIPAFAQGTQQLAQSIARSTAFSIAGGGDTLAAVSTFGVKEKINYLSTGGGAFLEFLEGRPLPAVQVLLQ